MYPVATYGGGIQQDKLFSTVIPEKRVPADHTLRPIRETLKKALRELGADFNSLYADPGRVIRFPRRSC
jgi:hypothetical protein